MRTGFRLRITALGILGWAALSSAVSAQPTTVRVLQDVRLLEGNDCAYFQIEFNFPVQYISHFPPDAGDELRIQINPIIVNPRDRCDLLINPEERCNCLLNPQDRSDCLLNPRDRSPLLQREALSPPEGGDLGLLSIIYDGELSAGPVLTLQFRRPLSYSVGQGHDFRSVLVGIPGPDRTTPCLPLR